MHLGVFLKHARRFGFIDALPMDDRMADSHIKRYKVLLFLYEHRLVRGSFPPAVPYGLKLV